MTLTPSIGEKVFLVGVAGELAHGLFGVGNAVQRLDGRLMLLRAPFGNEERVLLLNMRRIYQHDGAQIQGGVGAMNRARIALFDQIRQVAGVVNVRVAQHDGVNLPRVERKGAVAPGGFLAMALKQAAFEQQRWPLISRRYMEPVVVRAAPKKWIFIASKRGGRSAKLQSRFPGARRVRSPGFSPCHYPHLFGSCISIPAGTQKHRKHGSLGASSSGLIRTVSEDWK